MGKMRKRISFIESVIVSPVKNTFALNLVYFFSLKSKGRIKKIKRGRGRKKRNLHIFFLAANENYHLLHKLERGRSKRKRGKYPRRKKQRYYGWIEASRGELTRDTETCTTSSKVDKLDELECKMI